MFSLERLGFNADYFIFFLVGLLTIAAVYFIANSDVDWEGQSTLKRIGKFIIIFPVFLALSMGLSLHNTVAVLQGYLGKKSPFVRTPKFAINTLTDSFRKRSYLANKIPLTTIIEGLLALYFLAAVIGGIYFTDTTFIFFHILLMFGYGSICYYSLRHVGAK